MTSRLIIGLAILLLLTLALYASDFAVNPYLVACPIDGELASYIGQHRTTPTGQTECQYKHVWIHLAGDLTADEPHTFWHPCEVQP